MRRLFFSSLSLKVGLVVTTLSELPLFRKVEKEEEEKICFVF